MERRAADQNLPRTCPPRVVFALRRPGPQREASRTQTPASRNQPSQLRSALVLAVKASPPYPSEKMAHTLAAPVVDGVSEAQALDHWEEEEEEDALCEDSLFLFILSGTLAQA